VLRDQPYRVCHVVANLEYGGGQMQLVHYLRAADRARFVHTVLCIGPEGPLADELRTMGIEVAVIGKYSGKLDLIGASWQLRKMLRAFNPQVVHMQGFRTGWRTRLVAMTLRPRPALVYTEHGLNPWKKRWSLWIDRILARWTDALISVSRASLDLRRKREKYPVERSMVVYNGIDITRFVVANNQQALREQLGISPSAVVITVVARLEPVKSISTLIKAMASIKAKGPYHLMIVGDGSSRSELEQLIHNLELDSCVNLLGFREDIPQILSISDIFCLPSLREDFPVSVLEAMAAKLPVVASRVGGVPELVIDNETGILVPPDNVERLALALHTLGSDPALRKRMGQLGQQIVHKSYTIEKQVQTLETLYIRLS